MDRETSVDAGLFRINSIRGCATYFIPITCDTMTYASPSLRTLTRARCVHERHPIDTLVLAEVFGDNLQRSGKALWTKFQRNQPTCCMGDATGCTLMPVGMLLQRKPLLDPIEPQM